MKYDKYKIEDIEINGTVYFDDVYIGNKLIQSNYDDYWTIHHINGSKLLINLLEKHYYTIDVSDVRQYNKPPK